MKPKNKGKTPRKDIRNEIIGKMEISLSFLQAELGPKKFSKRLARAAKVLSKGLPGKQKPTDDVVMVPQKSALK
jgi:hypothetical protein